MKLHRNTDKQLKVKQSKTKERNSNSFTCFNYSNQTQFKNENASAACVV